MSSITTQQTKLDLKLVPKEIRLEIRKCNGRLNHGKIQREPTFQVILDALALALTPCYSAFLITADVPEMYMLQFWDSVYKHDTFYIFKMDKRKRFKLNLEIFKDIFKICPRVQGQDFDALSTDEEIVYFLRELGHTEEINSLNDVVDHMHQPWRTFAALINKSLSRKTTEPTKNLKRVKRPTKKSTKASARGVVIRETLEMPLSKKNKKVDVTRDDSNNEQDSSGEDSDQENDNDDDKTQSDNENESVFEHETDETELGSKSDHEENKEDEDDEDQLYDDVDIRLNEPVDTDKGFVQEEGIDAAMTNVQQGNENPEILQVIEDAHVTLSTILQKTEVLVTSSSYSSDLAAKLLNFSSIPHTDVDIVSPIDVHVHHEVPSQQTPTLLTIPVSVISDSSPVFSTVIPQSLPSFTPPPHQSTSTPPPTTTNPSSTRLNFASVFRFNNRVTTLEKEAAATRTEFELKKIMINKMDKSESYLATPEHRECYEGLKKSYDLEKTIFSTYGNKSQSKSSGKSILSKEPEFEVAELDMPQDQEENPGNNDEEPKEKPYRRNLIGKNPEGGGYPFDLTKPLPLVVNENRQMLLVDYFFNNDPKYLQGGIATMTYMTSLTKTKAAQYDLPGIEDMVSNIWSSIKVAYDKYALWATRVEIMRKHGYGYLKEIEVRRADNDLYTFKEGDFPRLPLRMFTRSIVIQKRVKDLQLAVESYQKKIIVTKPKTTRLGIRKKDPYTPYRDPQGFIYVDTLGRNRLMRSDELYKQLKERRILRSLEKFVGGRHYETDLRLLQRSI
nr:hypothetical protein [Tanacetum cinerariifolium]